MAEIRHPARAAGWVVVNAMIVRKFGPIVAMGFAPVRFPANGARFEECLGMTGLLLAGHLLCMNIGAAGPLACWLLDELHRRGNLAAAMAGRQLTIWSLAGLIVGAQFGLLLGWAHWNDDYAQLWAVRLHWKMMWAIGELAFSLVLAAILVAVPPRPDRPPHRWGWRTWLMILSATNLMYHFPPLMSIAALEAGRLEASTTLLKGAAFRALMVESAVLARTAHFVLAAIAATGVCILGFALRSERQGLDPKQIRGLRQLGGWLTLAPTLLQMGGGLWLFATLSPVEQPRLLGGDWLATSALLVSVLLALAMMQDLTQVLFGDDRRVLSVRVMAYFVLIVILMTTSLDRLHSSRRTDRAASVSAYPQIGQSA